MIATLIELQRLKSLQRTGWMLRGVARGAESVADHSYGVAVAAMLLADKLRADGVTIDVERVLRIALVHDWAEVRVGDLPRTATNYFGAEARRLAESVAFKDIVKPVDEVNGGENYRELHDEYEHRSSLEAKIVKAADVIDLLVQTLAFERAGIRGLDEFWEGLTERPPELDGAAGELVNGIMDELARERRNLYNPPERVTH